MFGLPWLPPYDWQWMVGFLQARAVSGIERFQDGSYPRSWRCGEHHGLITMSPDAAHNRLCITLTAGLMPVPDQALDGVARLLDLHCDPQLLQRTLGSLAAATPGLRLPGAREAFDQGIKAIPGQPVTLTMAATLTGKLVPSCRAT